MKTQIKMSRAVSPAVLSSFLLFNPAHAQGLYAGINIGSTDFDGSQFGESGTGLGVHIGFDLGPWFGVKLSYTDYREFKSRVPGQLELSPIAISLSGVVKYPIFDDLEIYATAGYVNVDSDVDSSNPFYVGSHDETNAIFGLGFNYLLSENWELQLGAERTELNLGTIPAGSFYARSNGDLDILSIGIVRNF